MNRLGSRLRTLRGTRSLVAFARSLGLSYTFVREMERGNRLPSDEVTLQLAERLQVDAGELSLLTYCDRSPMLAQHLHSLGVAQAAPVPGPILPARVASEPVALFGHASAI